MGYVVLTVLVVVFASVASSSVPKNFQDQRTTLKQFTAGGYVVGFQQNKLYLVSLSHALTLEFLGTEGVMPEAEAGEGSTGKGAPPLKRVTYGNLWPGISVAYEATKGTVLKSTYRIEPGADVERIQLAYNVPVEVRKDGSLRYSFKKGYVTESAPLAWQEMEGKRVPVSVSYRITGPNGVGFRVNDYNARYPLVIDPSYAWHTFYGSSATDEGCSIALDGSGNVYVTGYSADTWQGDGGASPLHAHSGDLDIVVMKLDSKGEYQWHTFYGSSDSEGGYSIALDGNGNVYVTGWSNGGWQGDGGVNPLHAYAGGSDITVLKLNRDGVYQWHAFYGSSGYDGGSGIALDGSGNIYVAGVSYGAWQGDGGVNPLHGYTGTWDIVVLKLGDNGAYQWHTFYGSSGYDGGAWIAVDEGGRIYVAGASEGSWQGDGGANPLHDYSGDRDIAVLKLNSSGQYQWHTFYGSSAYERATGIALDGNRNVYVTAESEATWQGDGGASPLHAYSGLNDIVVLKLNDNGVYQWHTFYGSDDEDSATSIAVDENGNVYVVGSSYGSWQGDENANPIRGYSGGWDIAVLKLGSNGVYQWHTFYGSVDQDWANGITVDKSGNIYVTGYSDATWQGNRGQSPLHAYGGDEDLVVLKLSAPVQPGEGTIGTEMTIKGPGYGIKGKVLIGKKALKILEWTDATIRGLLSQVLPAGIYDVTIRPKGGSTIILDGAFTVMKPEIDSVEPASGSAGDEIKIQGSYFGTKKGKVTLGGKNCKVLSWTMDPVTGESEIRFIVPKGLSAGTHDLTVKNSMGSDSVSF